MANLISSVAPPYETMNVHFFCTSEKENKKEREHKKTKKIIRVMIIIKCHPVSLLHFCCGSICIF